MRKGLLGVERLNTILQMYLNPPSDRKKEKEHGAIVFREGDKVMQIKNNYQLEWEIRSKYGLCIDKGTGEMCIRDRYQGYIEASNVQVADEMVNMIIAQRAYELNSKAITTSDSMLETANNLKR